MRFAVFADIHANWPAFEAAYRDAFSHEVETFYFLGDLFGRGPHPIRCARLLQKLVRAECNAWVAGNHDWMVLGRLDAPLYFPDHNASVGSAWNDWPIIERHRETLLCGAPELLSFLDRLPLVAAPQPGVYLAHGTISNSARSVVEHYTRFFSDAEDGYCAVLTALPQLVSAQARQNGTDGLHDSCLPIAAENPNDDAHEVCFAGQEWIAPRLMLVGHTHIANCWQRRSGSEGTGAWLDQTPRLLTGVQCAGESVWDHMAWFESLSTQPICANPGSIGFARDTQVSQASYLLVDWQEDCVGLRLRRIDFDVSSVRDDIEKFYPHSASYLKGLLRAT